MSRPGMNYRSRRSLIESAGRLYVLERELAAMRRQRAQLDETIERQARKVAAAGSALDAALARTSRSSGAEASGPGTGEQALTPGKLPQRVLALMQREPTKIRTAADLAAALGERDVQKVRTALARLVQKSLVRRVGAKGEFTI